MIDVWRHRHGGNMATEDAVRSWSYTATSQDVLGATRTWLDKEGTPVDASWGPWPSPATPWFPASNLQCMREWTSIVLSRKVCGTLSWQP